MKSPLATRMGRIVVAVISGALFFFVFGLNPWWPAAWLAPIPLLLAAFYADWVEAQMLAWLAAAIGLSSLVTYYWKTTGAVAAPVLIGLQILLWGFLVTRTRAVVRASASWYSIFVFPSMLAGVDTLVAHLSPHGTAGSLAFGQMDFLPVVQIASVLGAPAIVFLVGLYASALAVACYRGRQLDRPWLGYGLAAAILLSAVGWGAYRLRRPPVYTSVPVGVASVDDYAGPGAPPGRADAVWGAYIQAVQKLASQGARIVVLPETILVLSADDVSARRSQMASLARDTHIFLVLGVQLNEANHKRNVAWVFNPLGGLIAHYDKQHMVPHLESDLDPGHENVQVLIENEIYGLVICRDMYFTPLGRSYSRRGVAALLDPSGDFNVDGWWASRVAALRGVEGGYSIVRAGRRSLLAVSDPYGHFVGQRRSAFLPGATLLAPLPLGPAKPTLYARFGDVFGWLCVAAAVLLNVLPLFKHAG